MRAGAYLAAVATAIVLLLAAMAAVDPALAASDPQTMSTEDIQKRREVLLDQMLQQPNNLDLAFEYVKLSEAVGDYEGAVSTLERMLIYTPDTPQLQLQLGILYYRLGAYDVARSYLEQTLGNPATPQAVSQQVQLYLQQLTLTAEPAPFSGSLFTGIRWESNANAGPGSRNINLNGFNFTLDENSTGKPDWSVLSIGTLHYSQTLKNSQDDRMEYDLLAYSSQYFQQHDVDLDFFEGAVGPSFNMRRWGVDRSRLFVYAIGDLAFLGSDFYFGAPGAGIRVLSYAVDRTILDLRLETRVREFDNSHLYPTNTYWNGPQTRAALTYSYFVTPGLVLTLQADTQREASEKSFYANWEMSLSGGIAWTFTNPVWKSDHPWTWQLGVGGLRREYDEPDYSISDVSENDDEVWGRTALVIPVSKTLALVPQVEYRNQFSNYAIRQYDDLSALVGLQKTF
jgi:tetratricopeptide (TPR) repeat protein